MHDVAIIGGGPAGAMLARLIGQCYRVLLVEKRQLDGPEKVTAVRLHPPAVLLLAQRPDDGRVGSLEDLDDLPGEPAVVLPRIAAHDLRHDAVARHRTADGLGRDEHITRLRELLGRDEAVTAGVGPEDARDLAGQRGQPDDVARTHDHEAFGAQRIERLGEGPPHLAANAKLLL